jgi:hypothetical protein
MSGLRVSGVAALYRDRSGVPLVRAHAHRGLGRPVPAEVLRLWEQHHGTVGRVNEVNFLTPP